MTREDIMRMAREANNGKIRDPNETHMFFIDELERFAALVAAAEREACAKLVEPNEEHRNNPRDYLGEKEGVLLLDEVAKEIRARSNE